MTIGVERFANAGIRSKLLVCAALGLILSIAIPIAVAVWGRAALAGSIAGAAAAAAIYTVFFFKASLRQLEAGLRLYEQQHGTEQSLHERKE